ncbi:MAG: heat-inducible transcription repressor HrcA [Clostridia bacterium]|nr:heat-inducible transcription repressor HrcA [Clostridia bacterium]
MSDNFVISDRKKEILINAVGNYIDNALPITSGNVQSSVFTTLSSATLRNELNALEEMGFLKQLHTSGGRIPTSKGYRFYVETLLKSSNFDSEVVDLIKNKFVGRSNFILDVVDTLAKNVCEVLKLPTFIEMHNYENLTLKNINIIPLITGQALVLVQTDAGIINNTINLSGQISEDNCKDASKFLSLNLCNKKISDILSNIDYYNDLFKNQIKYFQEFFSFIADTLKNYSSGNSFKTHSNVTDLLENTEYKDLDSAKKFLSLVENEKEITKIIKKIDNTSNNDIVYSIGEEGSDDYDDYSIIKANYSLKNGVVASIGVVGPKRLDYCRIASALKFITEEIAEIDKQMNKEE